MPLSAPARLLPFLLGILVMAFAVACGAGDEDAPGTETSAGAATGGPAHEHAAGDTSGAGGELQRYPIRGVVMAADRVDNRLIVSHEEIPGFMGAMAMSFKLEDESVLDQVRGGETIEATLVYDGNSGWLEDVVIGPAADAEAETPRGDSEPQP